MICSASYVNPDLLLLTHCVFLPTKFPDNRPSMCMNQYQNWFLSKCVQPVHTAEPGAYQRCGGTAEQLADKANSKQFGATGKLTACDVERARNEDAGWK